MRKVLLLGNEVTIKVKLAPLKKFLFNFFLMWFAFTIKQNLKKKNLLLISKIRDEPDIRIQEGQSLPLP